MLPSLFLSKTAITLLTSGFWANSKDSLNFRNFNYLEYQRTPRAQGYLNRPYQSSRSFCKASAAPSQWLKCHKWWKSLQLRFLSCSCCLCSSAPIILIITLSLFNEITHQTYSTPNFKNYQTLFTAWNETKRTQRWQSCIQRWSRAHPVPNIQNTQSFRPLVLTATEVSAMGAASERSCFPNS